MAEYIFAYHGGKKPESPEAGAKMMERWNVWIEELGDRMPNPGSPVGISKTVSASGVDDGGGVNPLAGYSIVTADSIEEATTIAKGCPFLEIEGTIEVAEILEM